MKKTMLLLGFLFLAAVVPSLAAPPVPFFGRNVTPLLYVTSAVSQDFGGRWTKRQIYIFRDGTFLFGNLGELHDVQLPTGGSIVSGKASPDQMRALNTALAAAKVSQLTDCRLDPPDSPLEWYWRFLWLGKGLRQNDFEVTQDSGPPPCPAAIEDLLTAVERLVHPSSVTTLLTQ